jgi:thiamine pyrophosphokinase
MSSTEVERREETPIDPPAARSRAIVLADGDMSARADLDVSWPGWSDGVEIVVAADGGARHAAELGLAISHWTGDGDSLAAPEIERLRSAGAIVKLVDPEKDESDTELAIAEAVAAGAVEIVILGALGGLRLDHALANVSLLAHGDLGDRPAAILDAGSRVRLVRAPGPGGEPVTLPLPGRIGDGVSLIPSGGDAAGVTTAGLRYPLDDETLHLGSARGLSNIRLAAEASVVVRSGQLLVIETPVTLSQ